MSFRHGPVFRQLPTVPGVFQHSKDPVEQTLANTLCGYEKPLHSQKHGPRFTTLPPKRLLVRDSSGEFE